VGMLAGLILYLSLRRRYLAGVGEVPNRQIAAATERPPSEPLTREERDRLVALLVLFGFTIVFWMAFEQASTSMNFFAQDRTNRQVGSFLVPAGWFQSVNPVVLVIAAPFFAALWTSLGRRGREPSTPTKMAIALILVAIGFLFMVLGARQADHGVLVSP